jgi:hypothetical protein
MMMAEQSNVVQLDDYRVSTSEELENLRSCCARIEHNLLLIEAGLLDLDPVQQATLRDTYLARIAELETLK